MSNRNAEFEFHQHAKRVNHRVREIEAVDFFNLLTGPALLEMNDSYLPEHRERLYPPTVTLSMFMMQALNEDSSCQKAVAGWAAQRTAEGLGVKSVNTGAYCKARQRLPIEMVSELTRHTAQLLSGHALAGWRWRGRTVKLVDGTGISMPDTPENQACYPQPNTQAPGVGFPLARLVDVLFAQLGSRVTDFRRGEKLGTRDHRVSWPKPNVRPDWMSQQDYLAFPDQLTLREVQVGGKILVTTMLDPREVNKAELSDLYRMRWNAELDLRNIKTTMGMDVLSCNTPQMNEKEVWVHLLAYNLTRLLMAQAAKDAAISPRQLSFKHTVQMWTEWVSRRLCSNRNGDIAVLFTLIAQIRVGNRPGRIEPRARKRRPKPYPWLKIPRAQARAQIAVHGHP